MKRSNAAVADGRMDRTRSTAVEGSPWRLHDPLKYISTSDGRARFGSCECVRLRDEVEGRYLLPPLCQKVAYLLFAVRMNNDERLYWYAKQVLEPGCAYVGGSTWLGKCLAVR